jgi:hypothetical protein
VIWRLATGLAIASLLLPATPHATTAPSLSDRIRIDGVLDEYAPDEFVLDATSSLPETANDSKWGTDDDISRVALTWDHSYLYVAVEGRSFDSFLALFVSNRGGGLRTLEDAGAFRRALQLTDFPVNLMALAQPERLPEVARADDSHPFALVDRGTVPAAVAGTRNGPVGFEMAVPWSMLSLANPLRVLAAITGEVGSGAGDAAPDPNASLDDDRFARAVLDVHIGLVPDANRDGVPDDSVSTRATAVIEGGATPALSSDDADVRFDVVKRAFAPDRGESSDVGFEVVSGVVFVNFHVYSLEGERVRFLNADSPDIRITAGSMVPALWDGRDDSGTIVPGGTYIVVAEWGYGRGEHSGREKAAVVVVR